MYMYMDTLGSRARQVNIGCTEMKRRCGTEYDPIGMEDWCDIQTKNYVVDTLAPQCFDLKTLLQVFETQLVNKEQLNNPTNRQPITDEQLLILAANHVQNGEELPPHLHEYTETLLQYVSPTEWTIKSDVEGVIGHYKTRAKAIQAYKAFARLLIDNGEMTIKEKLTMRLRAARGASLDLFNGFKVHLIAPGWI